MPIISIRGRDDIFDDSIQFSVPRALPLFTGGERLYYRSRAPRYQPPHWLVILIAIISGLNQISLPNATIPPQITPQCQPIK
jgi:hypothetical protein